MSRNKSEKKPERDASLDHDWSIDASPSMIYFGERERICSACRKKAFPSSSPEPCITKVLERLKKLEDEVAAHRAVNPLVIQGSP